MGRKVKGDKFSGTRKYYRFDQKGNLIWERRYATRMEAKGEALW